MAEFRAWFNLVADNEQELVDLKEKFDSFKIDLDPNDIYYTGYLFNYLLTGEIKAKEIYPINACYTIEGMVKNRNMYALFVRFCDFTTLEEIDGFLERYNWSKNSNIKIYNVISENISLISQEDSQEEFYRR